MVAKGLNAGPGAATGKVVYNAEDAESWAGRGDKVILVRIETSPEDIRGMNAAQGILTLEGRHDQPRGTRRPADGQGLRGRLRRAGHRLPDERPSRSKGKTINEGDYISLDGTTGEVFAGEVKTIPSEVLRVLIDKTLKPEESQIYQDFEIPHVGPMRQDGWG